MTHHFTCQFCKLEHPYDLEENWTFHTFDCGCGAHYNLPRNLLAKSTEPRIDCWKDRMESTLKSLEELQDADRRNILNTLDRRLLDHYKRMTACTSTINEHTTKLDEHDNDFQTLDERISNLGAHQNSQALKDIELDERCNAFAVELEEEVTITGGRLRKLEDETSDYRSARWPEGTCQGILDRLEKLEEWGVRVGKVPAEKLAELDLSNELLANRVKELERRLEKTDLPSWSSLAKRMTELEATNAKYMGRTETLEQRVEQESSLDLGIHKGAAKRLKDLEQHVEELQKSKGWQGMSKINERLKNVEYVLTDLTESLEKHSF